MIQQYISIRQGVSVSVAVSDASPDVGDVITLTATAAGFIPTQYQFLLFNGSVRLLAQQSGNVFNWTVDSISGSYNIYVLATDGVSNAWASTGVNIQPTYWSDAFGMPLAAYSLRKLTPNATNCIRIRRSDNSAETDIGFVANVPDSPVNVAAIQSFIGSASATVAGWYDQGTGAYNAVNGTATLQPTIAVSGVVNTLNGLPVVRNPTAGQERNLITNLSTLQPLPMTILFAGKINVMPTNEFSNIAFVLSGTEFGRYELPPNALLMRASRRTGDANPSTIIGRPFTLAPYIQIANYRASEIAMRFNGQDNGPTAYTSTVYNTATNFVLMGLRNPNAFPTAHANMDAYEYIIHNTDLTASRVLMEANVNAYYGIF
jgi:hypothetical protein